MKVDYIKKKFRCNIKQFFQTTKLLNEYGRAVNNPEILREITQEVQKECNGQTVDEIDAQASKTVEKIKCIAEAITEAVKETDYSKVWEEYKRRVAEKLEQVKACKAQKSPVEFVK